MSISAQSDSLLLHACCADCTVRLIDAARRDDIMSADITLYYCNPNIHPESEWRARRAAIKQVSVSEGVSLAVANWTPGRYFLAIEDLETHPPASKRCPRCWRARLTSVFEYALEKGFPKVSTTLFASQYQSYGAIRAIGQSLSDTYGIGLYEPSSIDREKKTSGFYKQNYCGCVFSLLERYTEKYRKISG